MRVYTKIDEYIYTHYIVNGRKLENVNVMMVQFGKLDGQILNLVKLLQHVVMIKEYQYGKKRNLFRKVKMDKNKL